MIYLQEIDQIMDNDNSSLQCLILFYISCLMLEPLESTFNVRLRDNFVLYIPKKNMQLCPCSKLRKNSCNHYLHSSVKPQFHEMASQNQQINPSTQQKVHLSRSADGKVQVKGLLPGQKLVQVSDGKVQVLPSNFEKVIAICTEDGVNHYINQCKKHTNADRRKRFLASQEIKNESEPSTSKKKKIDEISEEMSAIIQPWMRNIAEKDLSLDGKMCCMYAIEGMTTRNPNVCKYITKKEVVEEIANLVEAVVSNEETENMEKDFNLLAKILAKINETDDGRKLIGEMKLSFNTFEKLRHEMKEYQKLVDPTGQLEFDLNQRNKLK